MEQDIIDRERKGLGSFTTMTKQASRMNSRLAPSHMNSIDPDKPIKEFMITAEMRKLIDSPLSLAEYFAVYTLVKIFKMCAPFDTLSHM
jgi:hypothetical protein